MKLWLIRTDKYSWDDYIGFVISANTEDEARNLAFEYNGSWGNQKVFLDKNKSTCVEIGISNNYTAKVILDSFNAG